MKKTTILSSITVIFGLLAFAAPFLFEKKGESSIQQKINANNLVETTIHTQDYKVYTSYSGTSDQANAHLIDIQKDITTYEGAEGISGHLLLTLYKTGVKKFDTPVWKINEDGTDWSYLWDPELILTGRDGCCGEQTGARAYNYKTGKLIMSFTPMISAIGYELAPFVMEIPNTPLRRLVGVISSDSSRDFPPELRNRDAQGFAPVAIIKYADTQSILQKILIKVKIPENFGAGVGEVDWVKVSSSRNEVRDGKLTLWDHDGQNVANSFTNITLALNIYGEEVIPLKINITNDRFDITNLQLPSNIRIENY